MVTTEALNHKPFYKRPAADIAAKGQQRVGFDVESGLAETEFLNLVDPDGTNSQMTALVMNGKDKKAPYRLITQARLDNGGPNNDDISRVGHHYLTNLDPEVIPALWILNAAVIPVFAHSGGFGRVMKPLQEFLGIPFYTNEIYLDRKTGRYTVLGDSILLEDDGKRRLMEELVEEGAVPLAFSTGGDSPKEQTMGAETSFALTTFEPREEAVASSTFYFSGLLGGVPVWLGEERWAKIRNSRMVTYLREGMRRILAGEVIFNDEELGIEVKERILFHLNPNRDTDVKRYLPTNGVIFRNGYKHG